MVYYKIHSLNHFAALLPTCVSSFVDPLFVTGWSVGCHFFLEGFARKLCHADAFKLLAAHSVGAEAENG